MADRVALPAVELVLVGHFGFVEENTAYGETFGVGGSGYSCALGATVGRSEQVGVVAHIGDDFPIDVLEELGVDLRGASLVPGASPRLQIIEHTLTERSFSGTLGVASKPATDVFPPNYAEACHLHLATMPPDEQMTWLQMVRSQSGCSISVDVFEVWAREFTDLSRELCYSADLVFMNKEECRLLFSDHPLPSGTLIVKDGENGACAKNGDDWIHVPAPSCKAIDTTGAGEILAGAFLALRMLGLETEISLSYAVRLASAKVVDFGLSGQALRETISSVRSEIRRSLLSLISRCSRHVVATGSPRPSSTSESRSRPSSTGSAFRGWLRLAYFRVMRKRAASDGLSMIVPVALVSASPARWQVSRKSVKSMNDSCSRTSSVS